MIKIIISEFLKANRKRSGYTAQEVAEKLKNYGVNISPSTLYGYESSLSMPNSDVFLALCRIYGCKNPLGIFGDPEYTKEEVELIEKMRCIKEKSPVEFETVTTLVNTIYEQHKKADKEKRSDNLVS